MFKILFFIMGLPMFIMSFFETVDVLPYINNAEIIVNGNEIVLSETEQIKLEEQIKKLFEGSRTVPAFGVVTDNIYKEEIKNGRFVKLSFSQIFEINGLQFDQLVFKVEPDFQGFNLMRGMNGVFQGRCIYIELQDKTMKDLYDFIGSLENSSKLPDNKKEESIVEEDLENKNPSLNDDKNSLHQN